MRSVPLGSWLVLFAEVLATGGPVNLLPTHCCESIDLAPTSWLLAAVIRTSNECDPLPNSEARNGPMGTRSINQTRAPLPVMGYEMITTSLPVMGSMAGATTIGAVA